MSKKTKSRILIHNPEEQQQRSNSAATTQDRRRSLWFSHPNKETSSRVMTVEESGNAEQVSFPPSQTNALILIATDESKLVGVGPVFGRAFIQLGHILYGFGQLLVSSSSDRRRLPSPEGRRLSRRFWSDSEELDVCRDSSDGRPMASLLGFDQAFSFGGGAGTIFRSSLW